MLDQPTAVDLVADTGQTHGQVDRVAVFVGAADALDRMAVNEVAVGCDREVAGLAHPKQWIRRVSELCNDPWARPGSPAQLFRHCRGAQQSRDTHRSRRTLACDQRAKHCRSARPVVLFIGGRNSIIGPIPACGTKILRSAAPTSQSTIYRFECWTGGDRCMAMLQW
jgi:hypothetical protein